MSGSRSTRSWLYENRPEHAQRRHHHGREDRVVDRDAGEPHGERSPLRAQLPASTRRRARDGADAAAEARRRARALRDDLGRRAFLRGCRSARRGSARRRQALDHLDPAGGDVAPAGDDDAAHQRAVLDRPDEVLARRLADRAASARSAAAASGRRARRAPARTGRRGSARPWLSSATTTPIAARAGLGGRRDAVDACPATDSPLPLDRGPAPPGPARAATPRACRPMPASSSVARSTIGDDLLLGAHLLARARRGACRRCPTIGATSARLARCRRATTASCACADLSCARAASSRGLRRLQRGRAR